MNKDISRHTAHCSSFNFDSSETVSYNNPLFPAYIRYGILSCYPDYSAASHWHEDLEFILVKKGAMTYNVNGKLVELSENNGIMVNSRQIHHGFSIERKECEFICILFSPELLQGNKWFYHNYIEQITGNASHPFLYLTRGSWQAAILEKLDRLYCSYCSGRGPALADCLPYFELIEEFCSIMKILYQNLPATQKATKRESAEIASLKNMITYVEEHFMEHIALEDLALAGACCKSQCSLLFKKYLRDTPISYITKLRLRKSLTALLEADSRITDVALEYGFGGASYYCEIFRKYYGISPLRYKKEQIKA